MLIKNKILKYSMLTNMKNLLLSAIKFPICSLSMQNEFIYIVISFIFLLSLLGK